MTVATRQPYVRYVSRLISSLLEHGYDGAILPWINAWPPGSPPHQEMHYAFKVHAVLEASRQGYDSVLWLDAACHAVAPIEPVWLNIETHGHYLFYGDDVLGEWISDQALAHLEYTRDQAMEMRLFGGCAIGLDLTSPRSRRFLEWWAALAKTGLFITVHSAYAPDRMKSLLVSDADESMVISEDPRCKGHRSDEACFALMADRLGMQALPSDPYFSQYFGSGYDLA